MKTANVIHILTWLLITRFSQKLTAQLYEVPLDLRLQQSTLIVEGKVTDTKSYRGDDGNIYTANEIQVFSLLKGNLQAPKITVITYGGEIEGELQTWTHLLTLKKEEIGLFFLMPSNRPTNENILNPLEVYSSSQGFLKYQENDEQEIVATAPFNHYLKNDILQIIQQRTGKFLKINELFEDLGNTEDLTGVEYNIRNVVLNGNVVDFDIYVEGLWSSYDLTRSELVVEYDPSVLGSNISTNGMLSVTKGTVSNSANYNLTVGDIASDRVSIKVEALNTGIGLYTITNIEEQLVHVQLTSSMAGNPDMHFDEVGMQQLSEFLNTNNLPEVFQQVFAIGSIEDIGGGSSSVSPNITDFYPDTITAGTGDTLTIIGTDFGASQGNSRVKFRNAHKGPNSPILWVSPLDDDYIVWSDTMIKVIVPSGGYENNSSTISNTEYAGTGKIRVRKSSISYDTSNDNLYIKYCLKNGIETTLGFRVPTLFGDMNNDGGYDIYYEPSFKADSAMVAAFSRALVRWRCLTRVNYKVVDTLSNPNVCEISFGALPVGTSTTLGQTVNSNLGNCLDSTTGNFITVYQRRPSFTMVFNNDASINWYTDTLNQALGSSTYDVESVSMHELGHSLLLRHSNNLTDLMYYNYGNASATPKRIPEPNDLEGVLHVRDLSIIPNGVNIFNCSNHMMLIDQNDCDDLTSLQEVNIPSINFKVYPNPTNNIVFIDYLGNDNINDVMVRLSNSIGQIHLERILESNRFSLNLSDYPIGIYFVTIQVDGTIKTVKIVKSR